MTPDPPPEVVAADLDAQEREREAQAYEQDRSEHADGRDEQLAVTAAAVDAAADDPISDDDEYPGGVPDDDELAPPPLIAGRIVTLEFACEANVADTWMKAHGLIASATGKGMTLIEGTVEDATLIRASDVADALGSD
jgi:hypothetical protein